jgi:hypothetical protein
MFDAFKKKKKRNSLGRGWLENGRFPDGAMLVVDQHHMESYPSVLKLFAVNTGVYRAYTLWHTCKREVCELFLNWPYCYFFMCTTAMC